jgi:hypothetical protein
LLGAHVCVPVVPYYGCALALGKASLASIVHAVALSSGQETQNVGLLKTLEAEFATLQDLAEFKEEDLDDVIDPVRPVKLRVALRKALLPFIGSNSGATFALALIFTDVFLFQSS